MVVLTDPREEQSGLRDTRKLALKSIISFFGYNIYLFLFLMQIYAYIHSNHTLAFEGLELPTAKA